MHEQSCLAASFLGCGKDLHGDIENHCSEMSFYLRISEHLFGYRRTTVWI